MSTVKTAQSHDADVKQFRDFLFSYNQIAEQCFIDCIRTFTSRKITDKEETCTSNCLDKYLKMTQRVSLRFQEFQVQQNEAVLATQRSGVLQHHTK